VQSAISVKALGDHSSKSASSNPNLLHNCWTKGSFLPSKHSLWQRSFCWARHGVGGRVLCQGGGRILYFYPI